MQAVTPTRSTENAVREAETDQRLRAGHGHVRDHHDGRGERAFISRSLRESKYEYCIIVAVQNDDMAVRDYHRKILVQKLRIFMDAIFHPVEHY